MKKAVVLMAAFAALGPSYGQDSPKIKPDDNLRFEIEPVDKTLLATPTKPITLNIWPGEAPGEIEKLPPEYDRTDEKGRLVAGKRVIRLTNVSTPQITVYKPDPAIDTGTSVIIAPGGGFNILAMDLEGTEVAEWLTSIGVTGILLKYRVPARNPEQRWKSAVQDAQRAVSLVRAEADRIGIDPNKIGLMGFSAGAMTAGLTTLLESRQYAWVGRFPTNFHTGPILWGSYTWATRFMKIPGSKLWMACHPSSWR